jgi:hypothetical protein
MVKHKIRLPCECSLLSFFIRVQRRKGIKPAYGWSAWTRARCVAYTWTSQPRWAARNSATGRADNAFQFSILDMCQKRKTFNIWVCKFAACRTVQTSTTAFPSPPRPVRKWSFSEPSYSPGAAPSLSTSLAATGPICRARFLPTRQLPCLTRVSSRPSCITTGRTQEVRNNYWNIKIGCKLHLSTIRFQYRWRE